MIAILIWVILFVAASELATMKVYGKFLKDDVVYDFLYEFEPFEKNPFDEGILGPKFDKDYLSMERNMKIMRTGKFISHTRFSLLSKYYIQELGIVPRWSQAHKTITKLYKTTNQSKL